MHGLRPADAQKEHQKRLIKETIVIIIILIKLNRVKRIRTTRQLDAHVILSFNANPTNWNNEPLAEGFNARAQRFF